MHHVAKFLELNLTVVVFINLVEQFAQDFVVLVADAKRALYFFVRNGTTPVFVKEPEGSL